MNKVKITLVKSTAGRLPKHIETVRSLGLKRTNSSVLKTDSPSLRGMLDQVNYLLKVEDVRS